MMPGRRLQRIQRDRTFARHIQAPILGMDTVSAGVSMPAGYSIFSYNLIGAEYGLRSRLGWREWVTGLDGEQVRSLLPFTGSTKDGASNRLFACTTSGIWDVSASTTTPTKVVTFANLDADSGWGISTGFVNSAGEHHLCYTDESNGYYVYEESTTTWTQGGLPANPVTGAVPENLAFVAAWKNRLWFVEKDTAAAWYLDIGAVTGAATKFNFGARFKAGGDLRGLWSWTYDGGSGIDDALVAVSGGGDVVVYKGTDPSDAATFALSGVWYAGAVPSGRKLCTDFGGDLLFMSSTGIQSMSKLVSGGSAYSSQYETARIANLWSQLQATSSNLRGWSQRIHPKDAALMITVPVALGLPTSQLVMGLSTKGWHQYREMPMGVCAEPWGGTLFFGTEDGRVCLNDGDVDGVLLADPSSFSPVYWSALTGFTNMGRPTQKAIHHIQPKLMSQGGNIPHEAQARFDWDLSEVLSLSAAAASGGALWGSALWDQALWGGSYAPQQQIFGSVGMGTEVAIAIRGAASSRMTWTGTNVDWSEGGNIL